MSATYVCDGDAATWRLVSELLLRCESEYDAQGPWGRSGLMLLELFYAPTSGIANFGCPRQVPFKDFS